MTAPKPPKGFDSWLDWCVQNAEYRDLWIERNCPMGGEQPHYMEEAAQAELAALRARVADLEQQVAALADALGHAVHRDHAPSAGCDGCLGIEAALRAAGRKTIDHNHKETT